MSLKGHTVTHRALVFPASTEHEKHSQSMRKNSSDGSAHRMYELDYETLGGTSSWARAPADNREGNSGEGGYYRLNKHSSLSSEIRLQYPTNSLRGKPGLDSGHEGSWPASQRRSIPEDEMCHHVVQCDKL